MSAILPIPWAAGRTSNLGEIRKQRELSWAAVSQLGLNPREGALPFADYWLATKDERNDEKAGAAKHWFSCARYDDTTRNKDSVIEVGAIVLDADGTNGKAAGQKQEGQQYAFSGADLLACFGDLLFVAAPTHSYTSEAPRWRIVFPLAERIKNRDAFAAAAKILATRINGYVDPRSYLWEQLWFAPSCPLREIKKWQQLRIVNQVGQPFAPPLEAAPVEYPPAPPQSIISAVLLQGQPPSLSEIEIALTFIDPDCGREDWWRVLAALASVYGDAAQALAHRWSRGDLWAGGGHARS